MPRGQLRHRLKTLLFRYAYGRDSIYRTHVTDQALRMNLTTKPNLPRKIHRMPVNHRSQ